MEGDEQPEASLGRDRRHGYRALPSPTIRGLWYPTDSTSQEADNEA